MMFYTKYESSGPFLNCIFKSFFWPHNLFMQQTRTNVFVKVWSIWGFSEDGRRTKPLTIAHHEHFVLRWAKIVYCFNKVDDRFLFILVHDLNNQAQFFLNNNTNNKYCEKWSLHGISIRFHQKYWCSCQHIYNTL